MIHTCSYNLVMCIRFIHNTYIYTLYAIHIKVSNNTYMMLYMMLMLASYTLIS